MHTDPISDMLTRIRNALMAKKVEAILPYSKLKFEVARVLKNNNYIKDAEKLSASKDEKESKFDELKIELRYEDGKPAITKIKKISKPGKRVYVSKDKLPYVLNNLGIAIISTHKGLMTNKQARKKGLGGEVICEIY